MTKVKQVFSWKGPPKYLGLSFSWLGRIYLGVLEICLILGTSSLLGLAEGMRGNLMVLVCGSFFQFLTKLILLCGKKERNPESLYIYIYTYLDRDKSTSASGT